MAEQLYLDFKIYHGLTSFSQNCIYLANASPSKVASPQCCIYKQIKCDKQLCKYNINIRSSIFKLEFCMGVNLGNLGQSNLEEVRDWFNLLAYREF